MFKILRYRSLFGFLMFAWVFLAQAMGTISVTTPSTDAGTTGLNFTLNDRIEVFISNTGTGDLTVSDIFTNNPEFVVAQPAVLDLPLVLIPGAGYMILVDFTPVNAGTRQATLEILSDDTNGNNSATVSITGYGGIEQSINLFPKDFAIELGQGKSIRAEVVFDNGAIAPTLLDWQSSDSSVVTATAGTVDTSFQMTVSTGNIESQALGNATLSVTAANNPAVTTSSSLQVVNPGSTFTFAAIADDRIFLVNSGVATLCYDFPESDPNGLPLYDLKQVAVSSAGVGQIDGIYVTAQAGGNQGEEVFFLPSDCATRHTIYSSTEGTFFADMVIDSWGNAIVSDPTSGTVFAIPPPFDVPFITLPANTLPLLDVGALSIDGSDTVYVAGSHETTASRYAAIHKYTQGTSDFAPIATLNSTLAPSSAAIPGIEFIMLPDSAYSMKLVSADKSVIERYVDLDGDGNHFNLVGTSAIPDPGEIAEVAQVTAGADLHVGPDGLYVSLHENVGRSLMRLVDLNADGDFDDPHERITVYQNEGLSAPIKDIAFPAACSFSGPPTAVIQSLPTRDSFEIGEEIFLLAGASSDPCDEALTFAWDLDNDGTFEATGATVSVSFPGPAAFHRVCLQVTNASGDSSIECSNIKVGPPRISGIWPGIPNAGEIIFIFGRNLNGASVCFDTICTLLVQVVSSEMLVAIVPDGYTSGPITVTTPIGSDTWQPVVTEGLAIHGFWSGQASVGDVVFVFGQNFSLTPGLITLSLNGMPIFIFQPASQDLLIFIVPPGATTGPICVTVGTETACSQEDLIIIP